jgi:D-beta-D-heptose 7-phosphate kinase/D-beta-D-heptose 1-phosphate adenosyltransferase
VSTHLHKVGLANGVFDLFHPGHRRFLYEAHKLCEYLIVAVNDDASVRHLKGKGRPIYDVRLRMDFVAAWADLTIQFDGNVADLISGYRPNVVIRGWDQNIEDAGGVPVVRLPRYGDFSTTQLTKEIRP